jgi:hypothetical protein
VRERRLDDGVRIGGVPLVQNSTLGRDSSRFRARLRVAQGLLQHVAMPSCPNRQLAGAAFAAFIAAAVPACGSSNCNFAPYCKGDELHECEFYNDSGGASSAFTTNCAADGRVCRQTDVAVACVFPDQPCVADACAGDRIASCSLLGLVGSYFDCTEEDPTRTCVAGATGAACGYPAIACPGSESDTVCGPDGVTKYSGCAGAEHPLHREDCSAYDGNVCGTANGLSACVNAALIPCTRNENFCSADLTQAYGCGVILLVSRTDDCAALGQICKDGWCGFDVPCDRTRMDSWCSSDGATVYSCGVNGLASARMTCDAGKRCMEQTSGGLTFAGCH